MATEHATKIPRLLLVVVAAVLWFVGWLVGKAWTVIAWTCAAIKVGWIDARAPRRQ